jgi:AcrR family transcriptional regulator
MSTRLKDIDERARNTRNQIAKAVTALALRQPLDTVSVQQITQEAGISRSTFYAHFRSLSDYLTRSYAGVLERGAQVSALEPNGDKQALPVGAILDHIGSNRAYVAATLNISYRPAMMAAGEERLRIVTAANLKRLRPDLAEIERQAMATFIAGGFMATLRGWMTNGLKECPKSVQNRFEKLCANFLDSQ